MEPKNYNELHWRQRRTLREEYIAYQNGLCYYCKASLSGPPAMKVIKKKINKALFPPNFFKYPIHLHHDHQTGMTIGAVHNHCNAVLWQYEGE